MNEIVLQPSRLPIPPAIAREYDLTPAIWRVLVEQTFPAAKTVEAILMALSYCRERKLDIFKRPVHIVPMWSTQKGAYVETVWPGIAEIRTTASRTGEYAGIDAVEFGPTIKRKFQGERSYWENRQRKTETIDREVEYPEWASVVVYRIVKNVKCAYHTKVFWRETYGTVGKTDVPNDMWGRRPFGQIDKCVEAAGLRKAFPEELGSTYVAEEMEGRVIEGSLAEDVPELPKPTPPKPPVKAPKAETTVPKPPKPPVKAPKVEEQEEEQSFTEDEAGDGDDAPTPGQMLSDLDSALDAAQSPEEIEAIWDEHDLLSRLESVTQGHEFQGVALGIKRRQLKRFE